MTNIQFEIEVFNYLEKKYNAKISSKIKKDFKMLFSELKNEFWDFIEKLEHTEDKKKFIRNTYKLKHKWINSVELSEYNIELDIIQKWKKNNYALLIDSFLFEAKSKSESKVKNYLLKDLILFYLEIESLGELPKMDMPLCEPIKKEVVLKEDIPLIEVIPPIKEQQCTLNLQDEVLSLNTPEKPLGLVEPPFNISTQNLNTKPLEDIDFIKDIENPIDIVTDMNKKYTLMPEMFIQVPTDSTNRLKGKNKMTKDNITQKVVLDQTLSEKFKLQYDATKLEGYFEYCTSIEHHFNDIKAFNDMDKTINSYVVSEYFRTGDLKMEYNLKEFCNSLDMRITKTNYMSLIEGLYKQASISYVGTDKNSVYVGHFFSFKLTRKEKVNLEMKEHELSLADIENLPLNKIILTVYLDILYVENLMKNLVFKIYDEEVKYLDKTARIILDAIQSKRVALYYKENKLSEINYPYIFENMLVGPDTFIINLSVKDFKEIIINYSKNDSKYKSRIEKTLETLKNHLGDIILDISLEKNIFYITLKKCTLEDIQKYIYINKLN